MNMENKQTMYQITGIVFIIIVLVVVVYFSIGQPRITGQVSLNENQYNMLTPFGFNFGMLVIGAMTVMFVSFLLAKEGVEK